MRRWSVSPADLLPPATACRITTPGARDVAAAVVDTLRASGRLFDAARLALFGRAGFAAGWLAGGALGLLTGGYGWPWWAVAGVGGVVFAAGMRVVGWAARRAAGRRADT